MMDRLEAMVHIEVYGAPETCRLCGHTMPSIVCEADPGRPGEVPCPILVMLQAHEPEEDVKARADKIRRTFDL